MIRCLIIYIAYILILLSSCSPAKKLQRENTFEIKRILKDKIALDRNVNYSLERIKLDVHGIVDISGNGKLYIKRNEFIYFTIQLYGIEMARALITKDSVHYINRLERKYLFISMKEIQKRYSKNVDFFLIQNFLVKGVLLPGKINAKHLNRFITKEEKGYSFFIGNNDQKIVLKYNELMLVKNIEILEGNTNTFINSEVNYNSNQLDEISIDGFLKNNKVNAKIIPGNIENNYILQPEMKVNKRYSEIIF